jgi:hypothetical protein
MLLSETVRNPAGIVVGKNTFAKEDIGKYTVAITNLGCESINVEEYLANISS